MGSTLAYFTREALDESDGKWTLSFKAKGSLSIRFEGSRKGSLSIRIKEAGRVVALMVSDCW